MYARKDIPTVLPDAVLRCRKLQVAANIAMDEMEKTKYRRINNIEWQQQTFQRTVNERHKRWRMYDRAFRLKLKRELGADLAAALRIRTIQEEQQKFLLEQKLIEQSFANDRKERQETSSDDSDDDEEPDINPKVVIQKVSQANNAQPKPQETKVVPNKISISPPKQRPFTSVTSKLHQTMAASNAAAKLVAQRPRTSRFHQENRRDTDPKINSNNDFGSVLLRILSNIAATPDLAADLTIRKRALEARERRLIRTRDDRYYNLVEKLAPPKDPEDEITSLYE